MIELYGKTAGIIGLGRIGAGDCKILNSMEMKVLAYDGHQTESGKALAEYVELDELLGKLGRDLPALPAVPVHGRNDQ